MKKSLIFFITLFILFFAKDAEAKTLPQATKIVAKSATVTKPNNTIGVYPRLRADRRALLVSFSNLQNATAVSYLLTYQTNIQEEGARGSLPLNSSSNQTQELLFGTCSKNVCRYHTGIKNMRLEVSYTLKSGKKYLKKYRIKYY